MVQLLAQVRDFPLLQSFETGSEVDLVFCSRILGALPLQLKVAAA